MDEDLYGGYNEYHSALDDAGIEEDPQFMEAVKTSYGNRVNLRNTGARAPGNTAAATQRLKTGRVSTAAKRMGTARVGTAIRGDGGGRPTTAAPTTAMGFRSSKSMQRTAGTFDSGRTAAPLDKPEEEKESAEQVVKQLEKKIHGLIVESALLIDKGNNQEALERAKEAVKNERVSSRHREQHLGADQLNPDLAFAVHVNLASMYERCEMRSEAINAYTRIAKDKTFERAGRLRTNIGNIHFRQKKYLQAIKNYRMALDQIPTTQQQLRNAVMRNIGHALVRLGQYGDAITSYEHILDSTPVKDLEGMEHKTPGKDFIAAFNTILCNFAMGDGERMKKAFQRLLSLERTSPIDDERYLNVQEKPEIQLVLDVIKDDVLRHREREEFHDTQKYIFLASKLISPAIEATFSEGYDWCVEIVKASAYADLATELEITKAVTYLKMKDFKNAIGTLKAFEKKEAKMVSTAATNLSFLYFHESQFGQADKYANIAMEADRYNPHALVNKGNCVFANGQYDEAVEFYVEALSVDSSFTEAMYNIGLTFKKLGNFDEALDYFEKLHTILPHSPEICCQIAACYELLDDIEQALHWYLKVVSLVPTDPATLAHIGELYDREGDKSQAFQFHLESFRYHPSNLETITWLGGYYVESQYCEKAIQYFERASLVQPREVKWRLMIASCYRRSGNYPRALETYKDIHRKFPDNIECLKLLVRISSDMGLPEVQEYAQMLQKAEKAKELREKRAASGRGASGRKGSGRRSGRDSSSRRRQSGRSRLTSEDGSAPERSLSVNSDYSDSLTPRPVDASYSDPIGAMPERPKTSAQRRADSDEEWGEDELNDMLPE